MLLGFGRSDAPDRQACRGDGPDVDARLGLEMDTRRGCSRFEVRAAAEAPTPPGFGDRCAEDERF
jgi:hypothetical protein